MEKVRLINIFISCPSDIKKEIDSIRVILDDINHSYGSRNGYLLQCLNWNVDTYTSIGEDAQDVINTQIETKYDILVGLLWQRIGTKTKRDKSGTVEEINRAIISKSKGYLIYFNTMPPEDLNKINTGQLNQINLYKKKLSKDGVLYKEYNSLDMFESMFRVQLTNFISDFVDSKNIDTKVAIDDGSSTDKYFEIKSVITNIENKVKDGTYDLDIFELTENNLTILEKVRLLQNSITSALIDFTARMKYRTDEINKFLKIKDYKLKILKSNIVVNNFADEISQFAQKIKNYLPEYSENSLKIGPTYSQIIQIVKPYKSTELKHLEDSIILLRDNMGDATQSSAILVKQVSQWPPSTSKFNKAKREVEIVLKDLTKSMLESLQLLDEALTIK